MNPRNRLPITIRTTEDARRLFVEFKDYMLRRESGHVDANINHRVTGAGFFVDFLCGIKSRKLKSNESYRHYPGKVWPTD